MISPVVTHAPCALDQQRRLREARVGALARWGARRKRARPTGNGRRPPSADLVAGLGRRGEDIWDALRG